MKAVEEEAAPGALPCIFSSMDSLSIAAAKVRVEASFWMSLPMVAWLSWRPCTR
jgi:hypothetical protein